jgi:phosphocarrier protein
MKGLLGQKEKTGSARETRDITILNRLGLHARPAAKFVRVCSAHESETWVEKDGEQVNGKSIMGLMTLAAGQGSVLRVICSGSDASKVLDEIAALVERRFDEE